MTIEEIRSHYRQLFQTHGDAPQAVQYSSLESQERRFEVLTQVGDLQGKKILDFGCGTGQLGTYLTQRGIEVDYRGVDIVPEFIELCRQKFPDGQFGQWSDFKDQRFDYIFVGGVFNNRMTDNERFYRETLRDLFERVDGGLAFNMMSVYVDFRDPDLFYEYPERVFAFLKSEITPYVTLRNDYEVKRGVVPFDFTVYAYRGGQ